MLPARISKFGYGFVDAEHLLIPVVGPVIGFDCLATEGFDQLWMVVDTEVGGDGDTEDFQAFLVIGGGFDEAVPDVGTELVAFDNFPPEPNARPDVDIVAAFEQFLEYLVYVRSEAAIEGDQGVVYVEEYVHGCTIRVGQRVWET